MVISVRASTTVGLIRIAVLHAVEQRVAEGRLAVLAAEGAVGVEQQAALGFARVAGGGLGLVEPLEVVARRGGEAELVADEVVEDGAGIAADGAVRFVGDDEVEVGRREELLVLVVEEQRLHGGDDDLRPPPVVAVLLVDDRLEVVRRAARRRPSWPGLPVRADRPGTARGRHCRCAGRA